MTEVKIRDASDPVGFFTVLKLMGVLLAVLLPALSLQAFVFKSWMNSIAEEKLQQLSVAKIEYDVRRAETDHSITRLESTDLAMSQKIQDIDNKLRSIDQQLQTIRERQDQVRLKLHMAPQ